MIERWIMKQTWKNLLFIHWPVSEKVLRPYIPAPLEVDTFQGHAWLGLVAFEMSQIQLKGLPVIPYTVPFPELNVRTYVRGFEKKGVFFLTLDASNALIVKSARAWYRLPYFRAKMSMQVEDQQVRFHSVRLKSSREAAVFHTLYRPVSPVFTPREGTLEHWLTERYTYFYKSCRSQNAMMGEIYHEPWQLQTAEVNIKQNSMCYPYQVDVPFSPPLSHYSSGTVASFGRCVRIHLD